MLSKRIGSRNPNLLLVTKRMQDILNLDVAYFAKGGFWSGLQQFIGVVCGLIVSYLFGHYVSKSLFGEYNLVLSILSMLMFLSLPGVDTALIRSVGQKHDLAYLYGTRLKLKYSLIGLLVLFGVSSFYYANGNSNIGFSLFIAGLLFPVTNSFTGYSAFLVAKRKFRVQATLASLGSIFSVAVLSVSIIFFNSLAGILIGYLLSLAIPSSLSFIYTRRFVKNKSNDTSLASYGKFLTAISVLPWISGNIGSVLLGTLAGVESLAIYAVATRFLGTVQRNFQVFYKPVTAKLASQSPNEHIETLIKHTPKLLGIGLFLTACLWLVSGPLIHFFFTETYGDAIRYSQYLSLSLIPLPFSWVVSDMVVYQGKKKPQIAMSTLFPIMKLTLYFLLIPTWGISALVFMTIGERFVEPLIPLYSLLKKN